MARRPPPDHIAARYPDAGAAPSGPAELSGQQIVFLSHQRWGTHVTPVHHTSLHLAQHNRVLFMEPPDSLGWLLHEPPARAAMTWLLDPLERKTQGLWVYHTPPVFAPGQAWAECILQSLSATYAYMIRSALQRLGFRRPLFWIYQFNTALVLRYLGARFVVYECAEEHAEYETRPRVKRYVEQMDRQLCAGAHVVIVPSARLLERKRLLNPHTYLVPWGVDVPLYNRAQSPSTPLPADLATLSHPIIGMFGMLDGRRLHIELLRHLARQHPDWHLVLVGRCMPNLSTAPLTMMPNVHLLGMRRVADLPAYCRAFDVCMIPYLLNDFTRSIMPLKLVEYLATGRPIVTTALPAAEALQDVLYVAGSVAEFEQLVQQALQENPRRTAERMQRAAEYDWSIIVRRKMALAAARLQVTAGHQRF